MLTRSKDHIGTHRRHSALPEDCSAIQLSIGKVLQRTEAKPGNQVEGQILPSLHVAADKLNRARPHYRKRG